MSNYLEFANYGKSSNISTLLLVLNVRFIASTMIDWVKHSNDLWTFEYRGEMKVLLLKRVVKWNVISYQAWERSEMIYNTGLEQTFYRQVKKLADR